MDMRRVWIRRGLIAQALMRVAALGVVWPVQAEVPPAPAEPGAAEATPPPKKEAPPADSAAKIAELEKTAKNAMDIAQAAKVQAAAAGAKAVAAEDALAEVQGGKFISSGLTGGVALAIQTPLGRLKGTSQTSAASTAMPYVMILPAYWAAPEATRVYCASDWGSGRQILASRAALAVAKEQAEVLFDTIVSSLNAKESAEVIADQFLLERAKEALGEGRAAQAKSLSTGLVNAIDQWNQSKAKTGPEGSRQRDDIIVAIANLDWNIALSGRCGWKKWGPWVGKPLAYDARTTLTGFGDSERQFSPVVALGVGWSPNSYFSLLAGVTLGNVSTQGDAPVDKSCWAGTFAIGGNLDLLGRLFK
jgi:hypothetical protein